MVLNPGVCSFFSSSVSVVSSCQHIHTKNISEDAEKNRVCGRAEISHGPQAKQNTSRLAFLTRGMIWGGGGGWSFCCEINTMSFSSDQYGTEPGQIGRGGAGPR